METTYVDPDERTFREHSLEDVLPLMLKHKEALLSTLVLYNNPLNAYDIPLRNYMVELLPTLDEDYVKEHCPRPPLDVPSHWKPFLHKDIIIDGRYIKNSQEYGTLPSTEEVYDRPLRRGQAASLLCKLQPRVQQRFVELMYILNIYRDVEVTAQEIMVIVKEEGSDELTRAMNACFNTSGVKSIQHTFDTDLTPLEIETTLAHKLDELLFNKGIVFPQYVYVSRQTALLASIGTALSRNYPDFCKGYELPPGCIEAVDKGIVDGVATQGVDYADITPSQQTFVEKLLIKLVDHYTGFVTENLALPEEISQVVNDLENNVVLKTVVGQLLHTHRQNRKGIDQKEAWVLDNLKTTLSEDDYTTFAGLVEKHGYKTLFNIPLKLVDPTKEEGVTLDFLIEYIETEGSRFVKEYPYT